MPSLTSMAPLLRLLEWKKMGVFSCAVDIPPLIHFCCFVFILTGRQREKKLRPEKLFTFFLTCVCVWPLCENREDINFPDRKPPIAGGKGSPLFFPPTPLLKVSFIIYPPIVSYYTNICLKRRICGQNGGYPLSKYRSSTPLSIYCILYIHPQKWYLTIIIFSYYIKL